MPVRGVWKRRVAAAGLALPLLALAQPAQTAPADGTNPSVLELAELPLDKLLDFEVTGPSRLPALRSASAAAVTVITRDEIRALGHRTLGDVLRSVRGVSVTTDRAYDYIGVRGFAVSGDYNTRVLLLIDGNRVNDAVYDQAFIGSEFPLDLDAVERVEFIPGPGSAVYGANALFAVVNVITRPVRERGGEVAVGFGSFGERVLRARWQQPLADGGWQIGWSRTLSRGETLADTTPGSSLPTVGGLDDMRRTALHARWSQGPWSADLLHADRIKGIPVAAALIYGSPLNVYQDRLRLAALQYEAPVAAHEQLTARLHVGDYRYLGDYEVDYPPPTHNHDIAHGRWHGAEARLASTRFAGHRLVAGIEWQRTPELMQRSFDIAPTQDVYVDDRRSSRRTAFFVEDQVRLGEQWTLHLGARSDDVRGQARASSPRVAVAWRPDAAWSFKAMHGRAFRTPNVYEAYYEADTAAGYLRNPNLRPERVVGNELSAEWLPAAGWRLSGSLFRNRAEALLTLDYNPSIERYRFENAGDFAASGAELELEHAAGALRWRVNATVVRPGAVAPGATDTGSAAYPRRMLKGTLVLPLAADWRFGAEAAATDRRAWAPGHLLVNLTLSGTLASLGGAQLQLSARNAFDRVLLDPGIDETTQPVVPQPRRQLRLELAWPFGR
jgi:outer membrane receptor protein involved in Fe transport